MRELPFADALFAGALSVHSIEHVPDPERALAEIARVLEPGGTAVLVTPNRLTFARPDEIIDPYHYVESTAGSSRSCAAAPSARSSWPGCSAPSATARWWRREHAKLDAPAARGPPEAAAARAPPSPAVAVRHAAEPRARGRRTPRPPPSGRRTSRWRRRTWSRRSTWWRCAASRVVLPADEGGRQQQGEARERRHLPVPVEARVHGPDEQARRGPRGGRGIAAMEPARRIPRLHPGTGAGTPRRAAPAPTASRGRGSARPPRARSGRAAGATRPRSPRCRCP